MQAAIAICKPGVAYSDIGGVIEDIAAKEVRDSDRRGEDIAAKEVRDSEAKEEDVAAKEVRDLDRNGEECTLT